MVTTRRLKLFGLAVLALVASAGVAPAPAQSLNPISPLLVPEQPETPVSPAFPGTQPGALTDETTGTNPLTGLPCSGGGSLAVSGAGGLADTATPPPDATSATPELPSITSVFGSSSSEGSC